MTANDLRFPDSERPNVRRAIADLEAAHIAGRRPDLAALAPAGPWRVPYLLALIPFDMEYLLKAGDRAAATVEAYLAAFPDLRNDADAVAALVQEEHAAQRRAVPAGSGSGKTTQYDVNARFAYRDRFPDLWPKLFPYTDVSRLPEPGERIEAWYRVERTLGRGGMGVVFGCKDERLKRAVAVKLLDPAGGRFGDATFRERFLREAEALAKVKDANVVQVYAAGLLGERDPKTPYFVMEHIDGKTLDARFRGDDPIDPAGAVRMARGIAAGLRAVHDAGLVHRDVNPRNVMLRAGGEPVLLDLGLVRSLDSDASLTETGAVMGTVAYMAPEQADGADVDHRADLFGLGCILYRALTGKHPFPGDNFTQILLRIKSDHPPPADSVVRGLPPGLGNLVSRLMAKLPEHRPPTAAAVIAELDAISANRPTDSRSVPVPPAARQPRRWSRWAVGVAGVLGLVVAVALNRGCTNPGGNRPADEAVNYTGTVDVLVSRDNDWVPVIHSAALPIRKGDLFRVNVRVDPPAYLYVFSVEPSGDTTPLYPWALDWGTRPRTEKAVAKLNLPDVQNFTVSNDLVGVTTVVAFARPDPLPVSDAEVRGWFEGMPRIDRAKGDTRTVVWFDDFAPPMQGPRRAVQLAGPIDPYQKWQAELKRRAGPSVAFATSVSFAQGDDR